MPEQLAFLPIDFGFATISDTFHFFNLQQVQTEIRIAQTKKVILQEKLAPRC